MGDSSSPSVQVILWHESAEDPKRAMSLVIPLSDVNKLTAKPIKWLHYLGWVVLGLDGHISDTRGGEAVPEDTNLEDVPTLYYVVPASKLRGVFVCLSTHYSLLSYVDSTLNSAVETNLANSRSRSGASSTTSTRDNEFRDLLIRRDQTTIISHYVLGVEAAHIIPLSRGDEVSHRNTKFRSSS